MGDAPARRRHTAWAAAIALAGVAAASAWVLTRPMPLTLGGDNETLLHPLYVDATRQLTAGTVPIWTTGRWGGSPLLGDPVAGALYPFVYPGYLATPFPHRRALDVAACIDLAVLVLGMLWCLRRLSARPSLAVVGIAATVLSPTLVYVARSWITYWGALAWWPWLLGSAVAVGAGATRAHWIAAASLAAQVYAGYPQFALYSGVVAMVIVLAGPGLPPRRRLASVAVIGLAALGLAAPQLLPGLGMAAESTRLGPGGAERLALLDVAAIPPAAWRRVLAATPTIAELPCKLAPPIVVLAALGALLGPRSVRVLAAGAAATALLATGPTVLNRALHALPGFAFFAGPVKFFYLSTFLTHLVAAVGLDRAVRLSPAARRAVLIAVALAAAPALGPWPTLGALALAALPAGTLSTSTALVTLAAAAAFLGASTALTAPQPFSRDPYTPLLRAPLLDPDARLSDRFLALDESDLVRQAGMNFGALWGLDSLSGVGPLPPWRQFEVMEQAAPGSAPRLATALGATRVVARTIGPVAASLDAAGWRRVAARDGLALFAVPAPAPEAFLAARVRFVSAADAIAAARHGAALEPDDVLVEATPEGATEDGDGGGRVHLQTLARGHHRLRVDVARPTWVVLREPYYANWRALVDGLPATVRPAGGFFVAVRTEAGSHEVDLAYREPWLRRGIAVALLTVFLLASVLPRLRSPEPATDGRAAPAA